MGDDDRPCGPAADSPATLASYRAEQRRLTRETTLVAGVVGLVGLPLWALFDHALVPEQAGAFLVARVAGELGVVVAWLVLRRLGPDARWVEPLSVAMVLSLTASIAWMVPRSGDQLEAYLLGLSLPIYATAFLLTWRWPMTVTLIGGTGAALAAATVDARGLDGDGWVTTAFYLATAAALALVAQVVRDRRRWREHVVRAELEAERRRNADLVEELEVLSREDPLTAVGNRRAWDERLTGEVLRARRSGRPLSVVLCDVDRFKAVNDAAGHAAGDDLLRAVAALLMATAGPDHVVARVGGDEFAVVCPDTSLAAAAELAAGICAGARSLRPGGDPVTCSVGVAELERADRSAEDLCHRADRALYAAKGERDCFRCAVPGATADAHAAR